MLIPLTVSSENHKQYEKNMHLLIGNTKKTILFAYDHRIEHLQYDFYGQGVDQNASTVEHAFKIATQNNITAFTTHFGLISRYASAFHNIPYVVKLTAKVAIRSFTNDAYNYPLWSVNDVIKFQKTSALLIPGVAITVYLGTVFEDKMLQFAAQSIIEAHENGLVVFLFMYLRNKDVKEKDIMLLAGAAGVANALGADFVKLHLPESLTQEDILKIRSAAGNTRILSAGGTSTDTKTLIERITHQFQNNMCDGIAFGRNLFGRSMSEAVKLITKITAIK